MVKVLSENIISPWWIPLELIVIKEPTVVARCRSQSTLFGQFYNISFHHSQFSGLAEHTNGIIKTQSAKFVEALKIPWPKALG